MDKFKFYNDPGHGWLRVPKKLLAELGIADKITGYSYMSRTYAYLEEDCDATTFHNAYKAKLNIPDLKFDDYTENCYEDGYSHVRYYPAYEADK